MRDLSREANTIVRDFEESLGKTGDAYRAIKARKAIKILVDALKLSILLEDLDSELSLRRSIGVVFCKLIACMKLIPSNVKMVVSKADEKEIISLFDDALLKFSECLS